MTIGKMDYKTSNINNRRYLGNKYKLLDFITRIINDKCNNVNIIADIFAGTGAVSSAFPQKEIITNDLMYSNYIANFAWFGNQKYNKNKIIEYIVYYNKLNIEENNYMSKNFANTYFSYKDCAKIGFIREDIEKKYNEKSLNDRERALLITALLYAMDKIANTCGHYDAYRKGISFDKSLELYVPMAKLKHLNNQCFNLDANELVKNISADLVYIDPPYNSRQYCDSYHLLENVARWEKKAVFGEAKKMNRNSMKSAYSTNQATNAFEDLIKNIKARYILFSYNNMAKKGNDRSNAKISDENIMRILSSKGKVEIFSENYKAFNCGKTDIKDNAERLFLCTCHNMDTIVKSPLNYMGGKYKLIKNFKKYFPKNINTFVDLFCGGCNVGINIYSKKVIFNDINDSILKIYTLFKTQEKSKIFQKINNIIKKYKLSESAKHGYEFYNCTSPVGLSQYNKNSFLQLRQDFNKLTSKDDKYYIMLYILIIFAFNNQIRFNLKGEFNLPVGKRDFNDCMQEKLSTFIDRIQYIDSSFLNLDFRDFDINNLDGNDLVYVDPPYLITCATYNEKNGWTEKDEFDLLLFLDNLHKKRIKFALSNVLSSKGKNNEILIQWLTQNPKYKVINLDKSYANSNYQTKDKISKSKEVLIINY